MEYSPGDSIGIVVENDARVVDIVLKRLKDKFGIEGTEIVLIEETGEKVSERCVAEYIIIIHVTNTPSFANTFTLVGRCR